MKNQNKTIAVLGSCATRDNFNSKFNKNYKQLYNCLVTQNQTSLISLASIPTDFHKKEMGDLSDYTLENIKSDFTNNFFNKIATENPEVIIIDLFADIHFGVIEVNPNQYITDNRWMLGKSDYYKNTKDYLEQKTLNISSNTEMYIDLWKKSADNVISRIYELLPNCKIVIHKARNVKYYKTDENNLIELSNSGKVKKIDVNKLNQLWDSLDNYLIKKFNLDFIDLNSSEYYSYENHPWGPFYVHYSMDYYPEFLYKLNKIVLFNTLSKQSIEYRLFSEINNFKSEKLQPNNTSQLIFPDLKKVEKKNKGLIHRIIYKLKAGY